MSAGVLLSAVGACFLGGILPWISNEAVVAGAVLLLSPEWIPVLVLGASAAQLGAKTGLYALARWAPHRLPRRARSALDRSHRLVAGRPRRAALLILVSAAAGVPPFYLTTLAAGAFGTPLAVFLGAGGAGVVVRTGAVAWVATATFHLQRPEDPMRSHRDPNASLRPRNVPAGAALAAALAVTATLAPAPLAAQVRAPALRGLALQCRAPDAPDPVAHRVAHALAAVKAGGPETRFHQVMDSLEAALPADGGGVEAAYRRAAILGARVDVLGGRDQVEAAGTLHRQVEDLLQADPDHGGAHHLLGRLHAGVVRLGGFKRTAARILYGGELLSRASWSAARSHLEAGERGAPCLAEHHYELARVLAETGDMAGAQREVGHVLELTLGDGVAAAGPRDAGLRARALELLDGA